MAPRDDSRPPRTRRNRDRERTGSRSRDRTRDRERDRTRERDRDPERRRERDRTRDRTRERDPDREARRQRRRSSAQPSRRHEHDDDRRRPRHRSESRDERERRRSRARSAGLSSSALAQYEQEQRREEEQRIRENEQRQIEREQRRQARRQARREQGRMPREEYTEIGVEKPRDKKGLKRRVVSGAVMEEGRGKGYSALRGGAGTDESVEKEALYEQKRPWWKRRRIWMYISAGVVALIIIIVVAAVVSKNNSDDDDDADDGPSTSDLDDIDRDSIPEKHRGTELDPWTWADTSGFNLTFTSETVGGLPVMGLYSDWDDSTAPNDKVPPIDKPWGSYEKTPARGVNVGGWLVLEPFITPSLFDYDSGYGIIDEYTLSEHLGKRAREKLEEHYATFITESDFQDIAKAGLDHVRIPYHYWAVETYEGDPYVERTQWRYLLRAIEWARKYGLRVNLDLHSLPGSQNGWNHSGRQGAIGWLNGTDGDSNADKSLDLHDKLSKFFAQDRYRNIITFYGLANEPKMTKLDEDSVVSWTRDAYDLVRDNGIKAVIVFGDGFMGHKKWQGVLSGLDDLALDMHQYVLFNPGQISYTHKKKVEYACDEWSKQARESMDTSTGFGPTVFAEWSQADTDCAKHVTNVGWGNRWEGTYDAKDTGEPSVLEPGCPTKDDRCSCKQANAGTGSYSDEYKKFLKMFVEAQMHAFEKGWGWWYWTWKTESAPQWSYKTALDAGIMPEKAYERDFNCDSDVPDFDDLPEYY